VCVGGGVWGGGGGRPPPPPRGCSRRVKVNKNVPITAPTHGEGVRVSEGEFSLCVDLFRSLARYLV
jgi:hypothetical protein